MRELSKSYNCNIRQQGKLQYRSETIPLSNLSRATEFSYILKQHSGNFASGITFVSIREPDTFLSYGELFRRASATLKRFKRYGIKAGSKFVLQFEDNELFLVNFWACILGKIVPIPLTVGNYYEHHFKTKNVCDRLSNAFLLTTQSGADKLSKCFPEVLRNEPFLCKDKTILFPLESPSAFSPTEESEKETAFIQYSSGSTGSPKGIPISHKNAQSNLASIISRIQVSEYDTLLSWLPLTHDMGLVFVSMVAIMSGAKLCLIPPKLYLRQPELWLKKTSQYGASLLYTTNFGLKHLNKRLSISQKESYDLTSVRSIYNAAEPVSYTVCSNFLEMMSQHGLNRDTMQPCYGLAEATVAVTVPSPTEKLTRHTIERNSMKIGDKVIHLKPSDPQAFTTVEVGSPLWGCDVRIIGNNKESLNLDHIGQIEIRGKNVISKYYSDVSKNKRTTDSKWINTGDLGYLTKNNRLVVVDRIKNIFIQNGNNVYFSDIERIIEEHAMDLTGRVAAISVQNNDSIESLVILIHPRGSMIREEVSKQIKRIISKQIGLSTFDVCFVKKIPKTTSGKIQHHILQSWYVQQHIVGSSH